MAKTRVTAEEKRRVRLLISSHFDHALRLLRDRPDIYFLDKVGKSIDDGWKLLDASRKLLPPRSYAALFNRHLDVVKKFEEFKRDWC